MTKKLAQSPIESLHAGTASSELLKNAERSIRLKRLMAQWPALRGSVFEPGPVTAGKLKLFVANPSALARIRQSLPSLIDMLQKNGWNITQIVLKIQTLPGDTTPVAHHPKRGAFSDRALNEWKSLESKLHDPLLLAATQRINQGRKK